MRYSCAHPTTSYAIIGEKDTAKTAVAAAIALGMQMNTRAGKCESGSAARECVIKLEIRMFGVAGIVHTDSLNSH